jgi:hypothetical protein
MHINETPVAPTDSIELDIITAFSPTGPYQIRVFADGRVERETPLCPLHPQDKIIYVDPKVAQKLLIGARNGGFRQLCASYSFVTQPGHIVDGDETSLTLSIGGKSHRVHNCLGNPPAIYDVLTAAIQELSPMKELASYSSFTPERKAECDAISAKRLSQH